MRCDERRLKEIEERHQDATGEAWRMWGCEVRAGSRDVADVDQSVLVADVHEQVRGSMHNTSFIAHSHSDIPDLLADVREARCLAENLEGRLQATERARLEALERAERAERQLADLLARQPTKGRS